MCGYMYFNGLFLYIFYYLNLLFYISDENISFYNFLLHLSDSYINLLYLALHPAFSQYACACQELTSPSVEGPVMHSGITSGSAVLIVSPPNISSTLTGNKHAQSCCLQLYGCGMFFFTVSIFWLSLLI